MNFQRKLYFSLCVYWPVLLSADNNRPKRFRVYFRCALNPTHGEISMGENRNNGEAASIYGRHDCLILQLTFLLC